MYIQQTISSSLFFFFQCICGAIELLEDQSETERTEKEKKKNVVQQFSCLTETVQHSFLFFFFFSFFLFSLKSKKAYYDFNQIGWELGSN